MYSTEEKQFMALAAKFHQELADVDKQIDALTNRRNELLHLLHGEHQEEPSSEERYFADFIIGDKDEAIEVLNHLGEHIKNYGYATVADLNDLVNLPNTYADSKKGWTNLESAHIREEKPGEFRIILPKVIAIDETESEKGAGNVFEDDVIDAMVRFIKRNPGVQRIEIDAFLADRKLTKNQVDAAIKRAKHRGLIASKGKSRGTKWYAVEN